MRTSRYFAFIAGTLGLFAFSLVSQQVLADDQNSPPPPEGEEYEQAELDFVTWCGPCHGRSGEGNGPVASSLNIPPPDVTLLSRRGGGIYPTEFVRQRVDGRNLPAAHGTAEMPVWGYWFKLQATAAGLLQEDRETAEKEVNDRINRLVIYLQTLQK